MIYYIFIKTYDILIKQKVLESYDLLLSFLQKKKKNLFWVWPILTPFMCKLDPKMAILEVLAKKFQDYWITIKVININ